MKPLKIIILLIIAIFIIIGICYVYSEDYQKKFFPEQYWSKQIEKYELDVKTYKHMINLSLIELEKMRRTKDLELMEFILNLGDSITDEAEKSDLIKAEVGRQNQEYKDEVETLMLIKKELQKSEELLKNAKDEYPRY